MTLDVVHLTALYASTSLVRADGERGALFRSLDLD